MSDIVFLVGAGRSGTTLLYKLLALHQEIAVITNYDSKLLNFSPAALFMRSIRHRPRLKKSFWFRKSGDAYFRPGLDRMFPYPVEGEPLYRHCGVPLVMAPETRLPDSVGRCLEHTFEKMRHMHGGSVFLSKRTANNRRLEWLREVFPEARFVNLLRDGRAVAYSLSTVEWWQDHTIWWTGQTAREMESTGWDRLDICARNWVEEVTTLESGLRGLPENRRLDLRYETLLRKPRAAIDKLLSFMSLENSEAFANTLDSLELRERPEKWRSAWSDEQTRQVEKIEWDLLKRHEYV